MRRVPPGLVRAAHAAPSCTTEEPKSGRFGPSISPSSAACAAAARNAAAIALGFTTSRLDALCFRLFDPCQQPRRRRDIYCNVGKWREFRGAPTDRFGQHPRHRVTPRLAGEAAVNESLQRKRKTEIENASVHKRIAEGDLVARTQDRPAVGAIRDRIAQSYSLVTRAMSAFGRAEAAIPDVQPPLESPEARSDWRALVSRRAGSAIFPE